MLKKIGKFLLVLVVLGISMGLILYPFVSNYLFENRADGIIDTVEKTADDADEEQYKEEIEAAQKYNAELATGHVVLKDPFVEEKLDEDAKEYNNLYYSAIARAEADWIVGINATRALTTKYNASLSCGRVQTPTLAMLLKRED